MSGITAFSMAQFLTGSADRRDSSGDEREALLPSRDLPASDAPSIYSYAPPVYVPPEYAPFSFKDTLQREFPSMKIIGKEFWTRHVNMSAHGLSLDDAPSLTHHVVEQLKAFSSLKVERDAGFTLLTLPKGLTLAMLRKIVATYGGDRSLWISTTVCDKLQGLGDEPIPETCIVAVSNDILTGTKGLSSEQQEAMLAEQDCLPPNVLVVITLAALIYKASATQLYPNYTRCLEHIDGSPVIVGSISSLRPGSAPLLGVVTGGKKIGMAALRVLDFPAGAYTGNFN